jgi:hypothetical protein
MGPLASAANSYLMYFAHALVAAHRPAPPMPALRARHPLRADDDDDDDEY